MLNRLALFCALSGTGLVSGLSIADEAAGIRIPVASLRQPPTLDGSDADWLAQGVKWFEITTTSASYIDTSAEQSGSDTFQPKPKIMAGIFGERIFFALQWQDERADTHHARWIQQGGKYRRDRRLDDMAALRFHTSGTFSECMLSGRAYTTDVWRWSAGRSQLTHSADDMQHTFSLKPIEHAAEYPSDHGTLYIKKVMDPGNPGWRYAPAPPSDSSGVFPGIVSDSDKKGSVADVEAFGAWRDGAWTLELARKLDTGDAEDIRFAPGVTVTAQLAFFNPSYRMQKQVTPTLLLDVPARKAAQK